VTVIAAPVVQQVTWRKVAVAAVSVATRVAATMPPVRARAAQMTPKNTITATTPGTIASSAATALPLKSFQRVRATTAAVNRAIAGRSRR
jgi:hypothetical protein